MTITLENDFKKYLRKHRNDIQKRDFKKRI